MSLQIIILALMSAVATTYAICAGVLYNGGWFLPGGDRHPVTRLQRGSALCMVIGAIAMGAMVVAEAITHTPTTRWTLLIDWVCDVMLAFLPLGTVALRQERYGWKHFLLVGLPLMVQLALILIWGNSHPHVLTYVGYGMYTWLMVLYLATMVLLRRWDRSLKDEYSDIAHKQTLWFRHLTMPFILLVVVFWIPMAFLPWGEWLWVVYYAYLLFAILFFTSYCLTQEEWSLSPTLPQGEGENENQNENEKPVWAERLENVMTEDGLYRRSDLTLTILAQEVGVNRTYLSQYINQNGGTFYDYVNTYRIEEAKSLLATTDKSMQEIADLCGFASRSSFTRTFRDHTTLTPTDYRKQQAHY